jgi:hypothetical protein
MKKIGVIDITGRGISFDVEFCNKLSNDFDIIFFTTDPIVKSKKLDDLSKSNKIELVKFGRFSGSKISRLLNIINFFIYLYKVRKEIDSFVLLWAPLPYLYLFVFVTLKIDFHYLIHNPVEHGENKISVSKLLLCKFARSLIFVSEYSFNDFMKRTSCIFFDKSVNISHGEVDAIEDIQINSEQANCWLHHLNDVDVVFWGANRGNRGLQSFLETIEKSEISIAIFSNLKKSEILHLKKYKNIKFIHPRYLLEHELAHLMLMKKIFVLPYINATQSGVFYSLLTNRAKFIATDVADTGDFLRCSSMEKIVFQINDFESIVNALSQAKNMYQDMRQIDAILNSIKWSSKENQYAFSKLIRLIGA